MAEPLFQVENVTKSYRTGDVEVWALRGVDLALYRGEMAVLLGPSGSGKSTLLNIMGGLDRVSGGTVRFDGEDLTTCSERQLTRFRREHVGFVFQFYNLIPSLTAWENVALVAEIASNPLDPADALDMVGLKDRMTHFPAQLSGGEQQRVAIARAIAKRRACFSATSRPARSTPRPACWCLMCFAASMRNSERRPRSSPTMPEYGRSPIGCSPSGTGASKRRWKTPPG